jgi:hypothetical protein
MTRNILIGFCSAVLGVFALLCICLQVRQWRYSGNVLAFRELFEVVHVHTNDTKGIVIVERKTGKPIWGNWEFRSAGQSDTVSYFFEGRNMMNVYPMVGQPPRIDIAFFGEDGTVRAIWANRGTNVGFTDRIVYGEGQPRKDIWFNESWHSLQHRTNDGNIQGGIVLDGKWQHLEFTNGAAVIVP